MKFRRWIIALIITISVLCFLEAIQNLENRLVNMQKQINELSTRIYNIEIPDITKLKSDVGELSTKLEKLDERVYIYEQDIEFWNYQVDTLFGDCNKRYFQEVERGAEVVESNNR